MTEDQQGGGEPIVEVHPPRGTILRSLCRAGASMWHEVADGIGGSNNEYKGMSLNCTNSTTITRDHLMSHIQYFEDLTQRTNMLKKVESQEVSKLLEAFRDLTRASAFVMETSAGSFVVLTNGPRKMTFWETLKWKWFGAVPYAKQANDMISEAYDYAGVVSVVEVDLVE